MICYSIEPRTENYGYGYGYRFLSFARNVFDKYGKNVLGTATKTGADVLKITSKKVVHKSDKAIGEFIEKNLYLMRIREMFKKLLFYQREYKKY